MPLRSVTLVLTNRCNLSCRYCYQQVSQAGCMSEDVLRAVLDELLASDEPNPQVTFTGGEPLLQLPRLRWAVAYLRRNARPDQYLSLCLLTNGTLLTPEGSDFLVQHRVEIQLSHDGIAPAQDLRGRGTCQTLEGILTALSGRHPEYFRQYVTVTMTVLPATVPYLARSVAYLLGRRVRRVTMTPVLTDSDGWRRERIGELERQFGDICARSLQHHARTGDIPFLLFRPDFTQGRGSTDSAAVCGALDHSSLAVDVDGQRYGCAALAASTRTMAPGLQQDFMSICRVNGSGANGDVAERVKQLNPGSAAAVLLSEEGRYSAYRKCADCVYATRCHVCPLAIGSWDGNQDPKRVPDFICAFNYAVQKYRERFLSRASELRTLLNCDLLREQMRPWLERD